MATEPGPSFSLPAPPLCEDLESVRVIGTGTFGSVWLVRRKSTPQQLFALKIMKKTEVVRLRQIEHVRNERDVLLQCAGCGVNSSPFVVRLFSAWQTDSSLFLLMEFVRGGELFRHLRRAGCFKKEVAAFYAAEVTSALAFLHKHGIIYRDLKPENVLIDDSGHVRLTDFGFSKKVSDRTWTLCGTPEYLAPESIEGSGHSQGADWWGLGILVFEMLSGYPPFLGSNTFETYERILSGVYSFPTDVFDAESRDFVSRLLVRDKNRRLGCGRHGALEVMSHPFFRCVVPDGGRNWEAVERLELRPPLVPVLRSLEDTSNFDEYGFGAEEEDAAAATADAAEARFGGFFDDFDAAFLP